MKRKFEKLSLWASIFLIFVLVCDIYLTEEYNNFFMEKERIKDFLDMGIVYRCQKPGERILIKMSETGLKGEAGGKFLEYNKDKSCYELYTYGEEINGTEVALDYINLTNNYYSKKSYRDRIINLKISFLITALVLSILAFIKGFNYNLEKKDVEEQG